MRMHLDANRSDSLPPSMSLDNLRRIRRRMLALREAALAVEHVGEDEVALVHPNRRVAARNLVDYLAVRQQDLRDLQYAFTGSDSPRSACSTGTSWRRSTPCS